MSEASTILLVGGTGRTGSKVLRQLLERGHRVRSIVRSRSKVPADLVGNPNLRLIEASLLELSEEELGAQLRGCDAVISCLGHVISLRGLFGPPWSLVTQAVERLCCGIKAQGPAVPVRLVLMSSVSVRRSGSQDRAWSLMEGALMGAICTLLPPARDNQTAADHLLDKVGDADPYVQWAAVRPDTLLEGEVSEYALHDSFVNRLFKPGSTRMANVAHFMCELATDDQVWARWRSKLPVIVDVPGGK